MSTVTPGFQPFGELNGPVIGIVLKEFVRRGTGIIKRQRLSFTSTPKMTAGRPDVVTSADIDAQARYDLSVQETLVGCGVIAEESSLFVPCTVPRRQLYVIIDPLDGTKAFERGQTNGVATQISLVEFFPDSTYVIHAAYVADVNAQEMYGYRPGSVKAHRTYDFDESRELHSLDRTIPLHMQNGILRQERLEYHPLVAKFLGMPRQGGLMKGHIIDNGSGSLSFAKVWKGEAGVLALEARRETPWDLAPVLGISLQLGFELFQPSADGTRFVPYNYPAPWEIFDREVDLIMAHEHHAPQILAFAR